jgi:hypothetical protein
VLGGTTYTPVDPAPYLKGKPVPADPNERGWKDTFRMNPGEVTRILVRFSPQDDSPAYAFDATAEPGYVWHCHILEHEENDMMRPFHVVAPTPALIAARAARAAVSSAAVQLDSPAPNPATALNDVRFTLATGGSMQIDLFSATGRRVATASGWYGPGEHVAPWRRMGGEDLGSGVYFVRVRGDGIDRAQKVIIAR